MAQQTNPRILGTQKIGKLLLQYSIPAIIGMTITSHNMIDSIFIGHGVGHGYFRTGYHFPVNEPCSGFLCTYIRRWCHYFIHPAGSERYRRSYGGIRNRN